MDRRCHTVDRGASIMLHYLRRRTLDGVKLDIPTHRATPPERLAMPPTGAVRRLPVSGTKIEAVGMLLEAPPFTWRDLYVYFTAQLGEAQAARLHYRLKRGEEKMVEVKEFPFEFTARLESGDGPVEWWAEIQLPDGRWVRAE